eukprot:m.353831 g.353831  ORF g.353831 m.353831 type:complete len:86 (-) comp55928_c1_seq1:1739-1996(-)
MTTIACTLAIDRSLILALATTTASRCAKMIGPTKNGKRKNKQLLGKQRNKQADNKTQAPWARLQENSIAFDKRPESDTGTQADSA